MMNKGDIYLLEVENSDRGGAKPRPVVIIDNGTARDCDVLLFLLSTQDNRDVYDVFVQDWQLSKLRAPSYVRTRRQLFVAKRHLQNCHRIGSLSSRDLSQVLNVHGSMVNNEILDNPIKRYDYKPGDHLPDWFSPIGG